MVIEPFNPLIRFRTRNGPSVHSYFFGEKKRERIKQGHEYQLPASTSHKALPDLTPGSPPMSSPSASVHSAMATLLLCCSSDTLSSLASQGLCTCSAFSLGHISSRNLHHWVRHFPQVSAPRSSQRRLSRCVWTKQKALPLPEAQRSLPRTPAFFHLVRFGLPSVSARC